MYNWREKRNKKAFLILENGSIFRGWSFGASKDMLGEAVFNTGMTGYEEIISDPSYYGQIVTLTCHEIGNYGTNSFDMESRSLFLSGLIINELNRESNYRSEKSLENLLKEKGIPGIAGIDTRKLTLILRSEGVQKAYIHTSDEEISDEECLKKLREWDGIDGKDIVSEVTSDKMYTWNKEGGYHVIAYDFGIKFGILKQLALNDMKVTVVPAFTPYSDVLKMNPDGVFLSNGPGDPKAVKYAAESIKMLIGKIPIMGICLGHQLISLASGAECRKLKFGHHGCNHPVKNLNTGQIEITSQNHNYAVTEKSLPSYLEVTHINLNDNTIEGIRHKNEPVFSIQYHPESAPGPHDSRYIFNKFKEIMGR